MVDAGREKWGWHLEQAWSIEAQGKPMWRPRPNIALRMKSTLEPCAILAEAFAAFQAISAVLMAVDLGYVAVRPNCRVLRQGRVAAFETTIE